MVTTVNEDNTKSVVELAKILVQMVAVREFCEIY
jgi:hypothetical protein